MDKADGGVWTHQMKYAIESAVFICGIVLMALEISTGKLLAFNYGGTIDVWGSIIGVVLGGLSIGYFYGGKLADRYPRKQILMTIIGATAFWIFLIPFIYPKLIIGSPNTSFPVIIILLLFPSILLGMVSPYAIKLKSKNIDNIGRDVGNLYAIATIGNVIGTFLATFVLALFIPINKIFVLLSIALFVAIVILMSEGKEASRLG